MRVGRQIFAIAVLLTAVTALPVSAPAQLSLEDIAIRSFDVTADLRPVPFAPTSFGSIKGKTVVQFTVTSPSPVASLRWYLDSSLTVTVSGAGASARRDGFYVVTAFNPPLVPGTAQTLTFDYEGRTGPLWDELILVDDGVLYPGAASAFGDISSNRAPITTTVTIPQGYVLVSTGAVSRSEAGNTQTYRWQTGEPLPYIAVVGGRVGFYQQLERQAGGIPLTILIRPRWDRFVNAIADNAAKASAYYSRILYPFPTGRLSIVSAPFGRGLLGIGFPSVMLLTEDAFAGGTDLDRDSYRLLLVAHEAAHTYFPAQTSGKGIAYIWLSEGFAEYLGLLTVEDVLGRAAFARELQDERSSYARVAGQDLPIAAYTRVNSGTAAAIAVRYAKGAYVLHMLRSVVGTEAFMNILKTYATRFRGQSVRVDNFQDVAQEIYGRPLDWFFQEWISQRVLPDYTIDSATSASAEGGTRTTVKVRNLGTGEMPVDLVFEMDGGERVTRRVTVGSRAEVTVEVTTPRPVRRVEVDPEKAILQVNYTNDAATVR